jgi:hypothetical protein
VDGLHVGRPVSTAGQVRVAEVVGDRQHAGMAPAAHGRRQPCAHLVAQVGARVKDVERRHRGHAERPRRRAAEQIGVLKMGVQHVRPHGRQMTPHGAQRARSQQTAGRQQVRLHAGAPQPDCGWSRVGVVQLTHGEDQAVRGGAGRQLTEQHLGAAPGERVDHHVDVELPSRHGVPPRS